MRGILNKMGLFEKAQQNAIKEAVPQIKKAILEELEKDPEFKKALKEALK